MSVRVNEQVTTACPECGDVRTRTTYDIGSGPELSCSVCEWCWGANGQPLVPVDPYVIADAIREARERSA